MKVAFRVDSGEKIGSGHLMRCLTLAHGLRSMGDEVFFIGRSHKGNMLWILEQEGYQVYKLPAPECVPKLHGYEAWLGVEAAQDAKDTLNILAGKNCDWLVVDHYGVDHTWESAIGMSVGRVMVIDDLANRTHDCDLLLDQNYFGDQTEQRYEAHVTSSTRTLLGPKFALLQPAYKNLRDLPISRDGLVRRVLVFFGNGDQEDQTNKVIDALNTPELCHISVDVVLGSNHPDGLGIKEKSRQRTGITLHDNLSTLAGLMFRADLMLSAGGATTWERMCLGCPAIVVSLSENQQAFTEALIADHFQMKLSDKLENTSLDWKLAILEAINNPSLLKKISARARGLVDGFGMQRVLRAMHKEVPPNLFLSEEKSSAECAVLNVKDQYDLDVGNVLFEVSKERSTAFVDIELSADFFIEHEEGFRKHLLTEALVFWEKTRRNKGNHQLFKQLNLADANLAALPLKVNLLSDETTWLNPAICELQWQLLSRGVLVNRVHHEQSLLPGDICFILSYSRILKPDYLALNKNNLVVHASALPEGQGWSPMTWQILEGAGSICLTLFEAEEAVDTGAIYAQKRLNLDGSELVDDWRFLQQEALLALCMDWIDGYPESQKTGRAQSGEASFYSKRVAKDSELSFDGTIKEQFNLLRVVDNDKYPAFFYANDNKYLLKIYREE